jgi:hypothetical protein
MPDEITKVSITDSGNRLKVVWEGTDGEFDPYFIDRTVMTEVAADLRQLLSKLVKQGREQGFQQTGEILHEIASKGYDLYTGLFTDARGGADGRASEEDPLEVRAWLEGSTRKRRVEFRVFGPVHIPWGLLFHHKPPDAVPAPGETDISLYADFWAFRYSVTTVYFRLSAMALSQAWPADAFKVLSVRNKEAFDAALDKLDETDRDLLARFDQNSAMILYSSKELVEKWEQIREKVGLLYFYCHANETMLALGDDSLSLTDFKLKLSRSRSKTPCLVFLNGCSTAVGDPKGGFLEATGAPGYVGFIGTETKVPTVFALRFGLAFLYLFLCKGMRLVDSMDKLRTDHWPLSLVYGPYCPATLQVAPSDAFQVGYFPTGNFCQGELGKGQL